MCYLFHLFPLLLPEKMEVGSSWLGPQDGPFLPDLPEPMEGTTVTTKSSTKSSTFKSPMKRRAPKVQGGRAHPGAHFCGLLHTIYK